MDEAVLAIDAGTSSVKAALLDRAGTILARSSRPYAYSTPRLHHVELDFNLVWEQAAAAIRELAAERYQLRAVGLSVLCPGLVALGEDGAPLRPALIHLDRRSVRQARWALERVGAARFLAIAANLPIPGGCSVTSMLWIREQEPEVYRSTRMFGHTNTFLVHRLTGRWGIDPTNASFTGLYDTMRGSDWDPGLLADLGFEADRLPPVVASAEVAGTLTPQAAGETGLPAGTPVVMGAGDTACAALGAEVTEEGDILNATGTVEVMVLCTRQPRSSEKYLIRTHAIPGWWLIMNIIPTGGEAIEWVRRELYRELSKEEFFERHLPRVLERSSTSVRMAPYLSGDRTSLRQRTASYRGLTLKSTRDDLLLATCDALVQEMKSRYRYYEAQWRPTGRIRYTGGGVRALLELKRRRFPEIRWEEVNDATLRGAARLAWIGCGAHHGEDGPRDR